MVAVAAAFVIFARSGSAQPATPVAAGEAGTEAEGTDAAGDEAAGTGTETENTEDAAQEINADEINKVSQKFHKDVSSKKPHSPKLGDIIFYNVWRTMASEGEGMVKDKEYWESTGLVNHEFAPNVKLGIFKKAFAKIMYFILKKVMK